MRTRVSAPCDFTRGFAPTTRLPELAWYGFDIWTRARPQQMGKHVHGREWEVHYQVRGHIEEWIDDRHHTVRSNDLFVMPPGAVHSGMNRVIHRCEMCWLAFRLPPAVDFPGLDAATQQLVVQGFQDIHATPFQAEPGLLAAFSGLMRPAGAQTTEDPQLGLAIQRAHFHHILFGIIRSWRAHSRNHVVSASVSATMQAALSLLGERLAAPLRVAALAKAVGLSRSALNERFVAETGLSPAEYLMRLRIERAKTLLGESTIAETAFALGFASAQHFSTVFKLYAGMTPGAFRSQLTHPGRGAPHPPGGAQSPRAGGDPPA